MVFITTCGIMLAWAGGYPPQINSFVIVCMYTLSHNLASGPIPGKVTGEYDTAWYWLVSPVPIPDAGIVRALIIIIIIIATPVHFGARYKLAVYDCVPRRQQVNRLFSYVMMSLQSWMSWHHWSKSPSGEASIQIAGCPRMPLTQGETEDGLNANIDTRNQTKITFHFANKLINHSRHEYIDKRFGWIRQWRM